MTDDKKAAVRRILQEARENFRRISGNEATPPTPREETPLPSLGTMAATLVQSGARWIKSGMKRATEETVAARLAVCEACEHWDPRAFGATGRCRKCGCGKAKLHLPHEKCPVGKWGPEETLAG